MVMASPEKCVGLYLDPGLELGGTDTCVGQIPVYARQGGQFRLRGGRRFDDGNFLQVRRVYSRNIYGITNGLKFQRFTAS